MNIEKAEVKVDVAHELGCRIDDTREAARNEVAQWEGANTALVQAGRAIEELAKHVDKDIDEGGYDLETAKAVKKYITRSAAVAQNLATQAGAQRLMAQGKVQALENAVKIVKKFHEDEVRKVEGFKQALLDGRIRIEPDGTQQATTPGVNVPGVRPGVGIKEQRLAEEAAAKAATQATETPMPIMESSAIDAEASKVVLPAPPEKKRGGKGKRVADA